MSNEINLLLGRKTQPPSFLKRRFLFHSLALGLMFIVSFASVVIFILIALTPLPSLKEREKDEMKRLSFYNEMIGELILTKDRLTEVNHILKKRPTYSLTLETVRKLLPASVSMDETHVNEKVLSLTVSSTSLISLDSFLDQLTMTNSDLKLFRSIKLVSILYNLDKSKYTLTLEVI